jgi:hypothetical protein
VLWLGLAVLVVLLQLGRRTPTNFADEFIYGRLAINLAAGDGFTIQGLASPFRTLYPYVIAPAWMLFEGAAAYRVALAINALAMTSAVIPAYAIARRVSPHRWALIAAAAAGTIPSMAWAGMLMTEALAYPLAALALFAIFVATRRPGLRYAVLAAIACLAATTVRTQLVVLFGVLALAIVLDVLRCRGAGVRERARRHRWALGGIVAGTVAAVSVLAVVRPQAIFGKDACLVADSPSAVELARPVGEYLGMLVTSSLILPAIALLALAFRRSNWRDDDVGPLLCVGFAGIAGLVAEAGWFAVTTAPELQDRYVFYITPLLVACVVALPGRVSPRALLGATLAVALYLVVLFPGFGDVTGERIAEVLGLPGVAADALSVSASLPWVLAALALGGLAWFALRGPRARMMLVLVPMLLFGLAVFGVRQLDANRQSAALLERYGVPATYIDDAGNGPAAIIASDGVKPEILWHLQLWNRDLERTWRIAIPDAFGVGQLCPLDVEAGGELKPPVPCAGEGLAANLLLVPAKQDLHLAGGTVQPGPKGSPQLFAYAPGAPARIDAPAGANLDAPLTPPTADRPLQRCNRS